MQIRPEQTRTALITGAGSGIGRAICQSLGSDGIAVVATDISQAGLDETVRLVTSDGAQCESKLMDVTDSDDVKQTVTETGEIDILVNCAGWDALMPFLETDEAFWDRVINLNFKGTLRVTQAALPGMVDRQWGRVVNIASDAGRVGSALEAVYSGAKGGLIAFSKTIAREMVRYGITVNSVCPGPTDTALLEEIIDASIDGSRVIEAMTRSVPMRRLGKPEDVAAAVSFLVSEKADYITGQTLSVSGGLTMA
jgi:2-hydroxycyclohexanecarboxyl-CoA dehydrogenase